MEEKIKIRCEKHPDAGIHFGEVTKVNRCNYCNKEVKASDV
jgi:hypothetical protein